MLGMEQDGMIFRGHYDPDVDEEQWCERRLLARIHRYTLQKLRKEIEPVSPAAFMRFLFTWHGVSGDAKPEGPQALRAVIEKLQGVEAPAVAWESDILPARLNDYAPEWMDQLCFSGQIAWGKLTPYAGEGGSPGSLRTSALGICLREDLHLFLGKASPDDELGKDAQEVLAHLQQRGALFYHDLVKHCELLPSQVEQGLAELVAKGRISADGFTGLRALLVPTGKRQALKERRSRRTSNMPFSLEQAGRWWLVEIPDAGAPAAAQRPGSGMTERTEAVARILLLRYGILFRKLAQRERCAPPWRELARVLRRMEDRGEVRGGRFVSGVWGEQFALANAIPLLRAQQNNQREPIAEGRHAKGGDEGFIVISAADPLNLTGVITTGDRIAARNTDRILYREGVPIAVYDGDELRWLQNPRQDLDQHREAELMKHRMRRQVPERLKAFYGKGIG